MTPPNCLTHQATHIRTGKRQLVAYDKASGDYLIHTGAVLEQGHWIIVKLPHPRYKAGKGSIFTA